MSTNTNPGPRKLTVTKSDSQWDVPPGEYLVKFLDIKDTSHPEYGAGLCWSFEIVEGPFKGKLVERNTAPEPTAKNSCGRIINDLLGRKVQEGETVDVAQFQGRLYKAMVVKKPAGEGVRVDSLVAVEQSAAPPANGQTTTPTQRPAGPGKPKPATLQPTRPAAPRWWVTPGEGEDVLEAPMTQEQIIAWLGANDKDAGDVFVLPENAKEGQEWTTARAAGIDQIPF